MNRPKIHVVPLFKADITQATYHMDSAEFGAFMRLYLIHFDHPDGLPADDRTLMRYAGCTAKVWQRVKPVVLAQFEKVSENGTDSKYVLSIVVDGIRQIESRSSAAKANIQKRWGSDDTGVSDSNNDGNTSPSSSLNLNREVKTPTPEEPPARGRTTPGVVQGSDRELKKLGLTEVKQFRVYGYLIANIAAHQAARKNAPGWDLAKLAETYDEGVHNGARSVPMYPAKAFAGWCLSYTKGKPPGAERKAA